MKTQTMVLSKERNVSLTLYLHDESSEMPDRQPRKAMLVLPGGGYHFCSDREAEPVALAYFAKGYQCFVLRYSLNPNHHYPQPLDDAIEALELMTNKAETWGLDPHKIAVIGFSAGGHLAAMLGTTSELRPKALLLGYPALDSVIGYDWPYPVPIPDKHTPETFIFHTHEDKLVPVSNALNFMIALDTHHIPYEAHLYRDGTHGLSLGIEETAGGNLAMINIEYASWFDHSIQWLDKVLTK